MQVSLQLPDQQPTGGSSGSHTSSTLILSTGSSQDCMPRPFLYSLYTQNWKTRHSPMQSLNLLLWTNLPQRGERQREGHLPSGGLLPGEPPPAENQQPKGPDCGLQQEQEQDNLPLLTGGAEVDTFKYLRSHHLTGLGLDSSH